MGLEEGEVIQHSMITRSIERAQKKVEQSNFAIRKRLLEYDNVMNAQREVIYKRRRHALLGKRLNLDTMSMIYDTVEDLLSPREDTLDREATRLTLLKIFSKESTPDTVGNTEDAKKIIKATYQATLKLYEDRKIYLQTRAWSLISAMHAMQDEVPQSFSLPLSDGKTVLYITTNLQACIASKGEALVTGVGQATILHFIDHYWKEHLGAMDDLKQSVQNAVYERQDPLLIYKFEGYKLFQQFIQQVNHATIAFLNKVDLPLQDLDAVQAVQHTSTYTHLQESKQSVESLLHTNAPGPGTTTQVQPLKSPKIAQRNQRVTVRYPDGRVKENVKFKTVEDDIANEKCTVIASQ
jgi:preprotein translocase subunit SecA